MLKKSYCTQNDGDCSTCTLTKFNKDCNNNSIRGGSRNGAGRPTTGRKKHQYYVTAEEDKQIKLCIELLRK